jgi:restriction endonuclease S subunit
MPTISSALSSSPASLSFSNDFEIGSSFVETDEPFCMGQNTVVLQPKLPSRFLYYTLNSRAITQQIEDGSYGSGYKSLSLKNIKELRLPVPPPKLSSAQ